MFARIIDGDDVLINEAAQVLKYNTKNSNEKLRITLPEQQLN